MGSKCVSIFAIFVSICVIRVYSHPIPNSGSSLAGAETSTSWNLLLALAFTISCAILVFGCLSCCKQRAGFKEFRNPESNTNSVGLDFVNPLQEVINQQPSRYSIFSSFVSSTSTSKQPESVVTFEPLPRVLPNKSNPRLPQFNVFSDEVGVSQDWLGDKDFPRDQLHYLRECGQGWFGKVVEGEARGIVANNNKIHRVFVRILKEDATPSEQAFFLREAKPYRDLNHANVLRLLGRCLENVPFLLVFEACSNGDLKSYLKQNIGNRDALVYQGVILRFAIDIASGLSYMLQHTFVHTDIAARNCLVGTDLKVKIGDYGISLQNYKEEYYFNGDIALPIRWCAPETLKCTETTIEPQQVTGASCIWSYGVLLWELEEWAELPYKELSNDEIISRVFGSEGLRLPCPSMRTPFTKEIYEIMKGCWKDYVDRPSFIHIINALSALLHRFKNKDFDLRWQLSKPNSVPVTDNDDDKWSRRRIALASKSDNDSGIDLDNPKLSKGLSLQQLQQSSAGSSKHRVMNDEYSSGDSPASSRRYSNSSTADLFSSPVSMKHHRSPSLENLHGSLDNICSARRGDDVFEYAGGSSSAGEFSWYPKEAYQQRRDSDKEQKLNFRLGLVSNSDSDVLWNNHQLFQPDSLIEDNSLTRRIDSLSTDTEDEMWRRRIERGEFTEKVKEKSKSVADLMILTHIDCSESSESDSLPSFHSRQSSFKSTRRGSKSNVVATASSLMNSLSFGSESNLPVVEKDHQFQETLKKIQIAKISGVGGDLEDSLSYISLQTSANLSSAASKDSAGGSKSGHFLANEASKKRSTQISSQMSRENVAVWSGGGINVDEPRVFADNKLPVSATCAAETSDDGATAGQKSQSEESNFLVDEARSYARTTEDRVADVNANDSSANAKDNEDLSPVNDQTTASISYDVLYSSSSSSCVSNDDDSNASSSANDLDSVVIGPSESHTLEYFKGLKTTLVDAASSKPNAQEVGNEGRKEPGEDVRYEESPRTLNDFLNECDDYFYKCDEDIRRGSEARFRSQYCDYCYSKCHFSNNDCLKCCKDRCIDDNCSCESFDNLDKFRGGDCATLNSCPFQSDDSGRGTDQINSGDGSSDKSLEGSISVQMNEVKNRLEDVIAKFVADDSDDNCSSLEEDKEVIQNAATVVNEIIEIEELPDDRNINEELECEVKIEEPLEDDNGAISRRGSSFATSEENEVSSSVDEDTCVKLQSQVSEDSGNCPSVLDSKSATASDSPITDSGNFVKVEQLFFSVDPRLEKEMEQLKSSTENNLDPENSNLQQQRSFSLDETEENSVDDEQHPKEAYEISDILEGLCEPISLPYSINEEDNGEGDADSSESSWLPSPIDDDYRKRLDMDEKFVELIRNELLEKLPNTSSSTLAIVEPQEEISSEESTKITIEYNAYPSQLSPILEEEEEEEEEEYSSLSSIRSMCSSDEDVDVGGGGNGSDSDCSTSKKYFLPEDDVLIVNTITNEASIVDKSDSKSYTLASFLKPKLNETYEIEENEDDTIEITDNLDSDSVPTPDSLSPGTSSKTGAHLSYSSSESGNLSDVFLSPSSSKNFDEFDDKSSPCDTRHLNTPENTLLYPNSSNNHDYQKAITNIDELLKNSSEFRDTSVAATAAVTEFIDPVQYVRDDSWLKSFFLPYHDTCSLVEFNSLSDISESESKSLPADFKSENWPPMDELCDSNDRTPTNEQEQSIAVEPYADNFLRINEPTDAAVELDQVDSTDVESGQHREATTSEINSSNNFDSSQTKVKNSLALFGNSSKQIRNFHVSLVKDDNYAVVSKTSPTSPKNIVDSYVANSSQSSEKTWKPPLNAFLNSQNLENFGLKEINVNDLMSTSFIECGSQDGSIDQDDIKSDTESEDCEEQCTADEFEWKKSNENDNGNEEKFRHESEDENGNDVEDDNDDDDDDDEDDEELADFVPYSWNIGAVPQKSALRNREKIKSIKKNVSFKKQKYHCVYEYPKDETNYVRTYDEILQDRMLGLWSLDRDNVYADYSSFSDWELDDCEESQTCSDDLMPYPGLSSTVTSKADSVSTKLGFYTIGAYEMDTSTKSTSATEDNPSVYYLSSPGSSSVSSSTTINASTPFNNDTPNEEITISEKCDPFKELNLNAKGIGNEPKVCEDYVDLPSPGLGELKHTKNRLKLDLSGNASTRNDDKRNLTNTKEEPDENVNVNDDDAENNTFNYGLNFKSCDLSPVVELPKSLTSASVA